MSSVMSVNTMSVETTGAPCLPCSEVGPVQVFGIADQNFGYARAYRHRHRLGFVTFGSVLRF
jgi:hypothetical protein